MGAAQGGLNRRGAAPLVQGLIRVPFMARAEESDGGYDEQPVKDVHNQEEHRPRGTNAAGFDLVSDNRLRLSLESCDPLGCKIDNETIPWSVDWRRDIPSFEAARFSDHTQQQMSVASSSPGS